MKWIIRLIGLLLVIVAILAGALFFLPGDRIARIAAEVNQSVENIGARRLYTVLERVFEELSFSAPDRSGDTIHVDAIL